ncbi:MAG TPA: zf-HC2 domain-containing protein [Actinomycetota bacterium]
MGKCGPECEETLQEIERFLDHEVDDVVRAKVERHLSGCDPCTDKAEFRMHLKALIQLKCAEHEIPDGLKDRLRTILG